jgi:DNA-binding XRE family transcriptional regulator
MIRINAAAKFSKADTEALSIAAKMLLNIKETKIAGKILRMAQNGQTLLSLYNNIRGRREIICINRNMVDSVLQDCYFSYVGNDKFRFMTEDERRKPMLAVINSLRETRNELQLSQAAVAKRLNVSVQYISAIECGRQKISIEQAAKIAAAFGMEFCVSLKRKNNSPLIEDD